MGDVIQTTWLLTRASDDAEEEAAVLERAGIAHAVVPCIECVSLGWPEWTQRPGQTLYFLTSRRAAADMPLGAEGALVAATAPSTSRWLVERGEEVTFEARGGAVGLAHAVLEAWVSRGRPVWNVRYPTSDAGLESQEQAQALECLSVLGPVDRRSVYATRPTAGLSAQLERYLDKTWAVAFSSPSAVKAFFAAYPRAAAPPKRVVCFGRSTVEALGALGPKHWPACERAERSVVETILSIEEGTR